MRSISWEQSLLARRPALVVGALAAAATAAWVAQKARRAEQQHPPVGARIEIDGLRLHYLERGEGPPVVLLHGNGVLLQDFVASGVFDDLAFRHRVVAFDRPGFGFSERPRRRRWTPEAQAALLQQAFARLEIERPIIVAHSWATLVALALGLRHPLSVSKLVLISGYYFPSLRLDVALTAPPAIPVAGDVLRYTISPLLARALFERALKKLFAPQPIPPGYLSFVPRELMLRPSQIRANAEEAALMIPAAAELRKRYPDLNVPTSILAGAADHVVDPVEQSVRLARLLPQSELTLLPACGHMLHHAFPEQVIAAIDGVTAVQGRRSPSAMENVRPLVRTH